MITFANTFAHILSTIRQLVAFYACLTTSKAKVTQGEGHTQESKVKLFHKTAFLGLKFVLHYAIYN